jgi:hypothetical protein
MLTGVYRRLDADKIAETAGLLASRVVERFPGSSLSKLAQELHAEARTVAVTSRWLSAPLTWVRALAAAAILLMLAAAGATLLALDQRVLFSSVADFLQGLDALVNEVILIGVAIFFLVNLEKRLKRRRALEALHALRAMAHIIDMHQLTKDPERLTGPRADTPSSPERRMTAFELVRYLDYCSEMLAIVSNEAALYVQDFHDPVTLAAVDEVQDLTTGLSQKVWQKITVLDRMGGSRAGASQ